jgi:hypothetical protein
MRSTLAAAVPRPGMENSLACLHRLEQGRLERIPSRLTLASDLGKGRSAQRSALDT